MNTPSLSDATHRLDTGRRPYYGWTIVGVAALGMVATLPGRTQGLGLITEPLLADLGLGRVDYAEINFVATLVGAACAFGVGSLIDRIGARVVLTAIAAALGLVVLAMSQVTAIPAILVLITMTRGLGQTALSIVSLAMVGKWFRRRLSWAMGVYALTMSVGFMLAFPTVGALVLASGWRVAWAVVGVAIVAGVAPIAWIFGRSTPQDVGQDLDGDSSAAGGESTAAARPSEAWTLGAALASPAFWVFGWASALYGLVASGIGLFNESVLAERGFGPEVYHQALAVTAMTGLAGNLVAGSWADRGSLRGVLMTAMFVLGAALAALPHVSATWHVMVQAVAMGVAGGFVMVIFFSFWGRAYGQAHLGRIQGAAQALTVLASALGPLVLAWSTDLTGSYATAFYALAATVIAVGAVATRITIPDSRKT
jgi:MFS family permease